MQATYYLGMMSGTSLDGVDIALVDIQQSQIKLLATEFTPMPAQLRSQINQLIQQGQTTLQALGELDQRLGQLYADCVVHFLHKQQLTPAQIRAIGCHGQTVWHSPQGDAPFTMQLGDMHLLAARTGIDVVGDFRRKDIAFGGQGAPLVPAFHQAIFRHPQQLTVVLNIGGISNISILSPDMPVSGFDIGPGNTLLDQWIERHLGQAYDKDGAWAAGGKIEQGLLNQFMAEPFLQQAPPKSTGRELFNLVWLDKQLQLYGKPLAAQDVQATLAAFTVRSIADSLKSIHTTLPRRLLVCGGGAKNSLLMDGLAQALPDWQVATSSQVGWHEDYVEAAAFAWLAYRRLHNLPANLPEVTGAVRAVCLGAIFPKEN